MTTTPLTSQTPRVVCPTGCKYAEPAEMHRHEFDVDIDGSFEATHEVDFGNWAFGTVIQRFSASPDEKRVTISEAEPRGEFTDPTALRHLAADLMNAADWLESVQ